MNAVYIEITNACNLHCSFCPCSKLDVHEQITPELFCRCLDQVYQAGVENVYFHVLGEPTLHPHFNEFLEALAPRNLKLTLTTNGTTIKKNGASILNCPQVRQVNFSTHAFAELNRDEAERHLSNILDFCEKALCTRPDLYINLRLWNVGAEEAASWNNFMLSQVNSRFGADVKPGHFCSRHKSFVVAGRIYLHEDSRFEWPSETARQSSRKSTNGTYSITGTCRALDTHAAILHDGRVVACCLDHNGEITLGQIQNDSLENILSGTLASNLREGFFNHQLRHPFCQTCSFCRRFK